MAKLSLREGDLFEMVMPDGRFGYGQIIVSKKIMYVVIFEGLYAFRPVLDDIPFTKILFVGWTMDALIYHGEWKIIGNRPISPSVPYSRYQVEISGRTHITDFLGDAIRVASDSDANFYDRRSSYSPIIFQRALAGRYGLGEYQGPQQITFEYVKMRSASENVH